MKRRASMLAALLGGASMIAATTAVPVAAAEPVAAEPVPVEPVPVEPEQPRNGLMIRDASEECQIAEVPELAAAEIGSLEIETLDAADHQRALEIASERPAVRDVAETMGMSVDDVLERATTEHLDTAEGDYWYVAFATDSLEHFATGGVFIDASTGEAVTEQSATSPNSVEELLAGEGALTVNRDGTPDHIPATTVAQNAEAAVPGITTGAIDPSSSLATTNIGTGDAVTMGPISTFQQCLAAAGLVVGIAAIGVTIAGCGTLCAGFFLVSGPAAPFGCAACVALGLGVPSGVVLNCLTRF